MSSWFASIVAVVLSLGQPDQTGGQLLPIARVPPGERLWIALISSGQPEAYPGESRQLAKACGTLSGPNYFACRARNLRTARYRVAALHAAPNGSSAVLASIFAERQVLSSGQLAFAWSVELASSAGVRLPWPEANGRLDDYGLFVAGVQRRGDWARLLASIPADGWLRITPSPYPDGQPSPRLYVEVTPLAGSIVGLSTLEAQWPDGRKQHIEGGGSYLVQKVVGDVVEFRAEIPSDFPCGEPVTDPPQMPFTLRAPSSEFFDRNGAPRFDPKYTKGCCPVPCEMPVGNRPLDVGSELHQDRL